MYKRLSAVMFPVLLVLFVGAAFWGYQENQEKNSILIKAENQYQRAFHNLSSHLDELHDELGNTLAVNSDSQDYQRKGLINVWRLTSQAQNEISQLPLTLMPFHQTEKLLASIAKFTYNVALRDMTEEPLTNEEKAALRELHKRSHDIAKDVRGVQAKVLDHQLRWMDVEIAVASEKQTMDNMIIDGFKLIDQRVTEYPELDYGPSQPSLFQTKSFKQLSGKMTTEKEIRQKAAALFEVEDNQTEIKVVENGAGTAYNSYSVSMPRQDQSLHADFSKRGGHLLWFMNQREVKEQNLEVGQVVNVAQQFLNRHGYEQMTPVNYDTYDHVGVVTMASEVDEVIIYPEKVTVKVALDNGEIIGLQATEYIHAKQEKRQVPVAKLSEEESRARLNKDFDVKQQRLALIETAGKEILAYEFIGKIMNEDYRVYINAETGKEEKVERIRGQELSRQT